MFTGELAESRQTEVTIRDIDENAMELLIDFCYTSHIMVEEGNVQTLLPAACLLQLAEIQVSFYLSIIIFYKIFFSFVQFFLSKCNNITINFRTYVASS